MIKLFLTDVDGCLTDGGMYYTAEGDVMKRFCVYDGMGMVLLRKAGIACGILTSENSPIRICEKMGITLAEVCYVGDDVNDIDLLEAVGMPCCPPNARPEVKAIQNIKVLNTPGGQGAVREIADAILAIVNCKL